jgi:hypothetical protein
LDVEVAKAKIAATQSWFSAKRDHYQKLLYAHAEEVGLIADLLGEARFATTESDLKAALFATMNKWEAADNQVKSLGILATLYMPDSVMKASIDHNQAGLTFIDLLHWPTSIPALEAAQQTHSETLKAFIVAVRSDLGYGEPRSAMPTNR